MKWKMTRREFLERFGMVGGSSLVLGAMDAWAVTAPPAGVKPDFPRGERSARVVVLGAGLTGLATAYELRKLGYDVQVLEARPRVGGVCHTVRRGTRETDLRGETQECTFDEGQYFNPGPWRIPHTSTSVLDYCRELSVPLEIFINEHDDAILYYEGEDYGVLAGRRVRLREVKADMRGYTSELLAKAISQDLLDLPITTEDVARLVEFLVGEGYLTSPDNVYVGSAARGSEPPFDLSVLLRSGFSRRVRAIDAPGLTRMPMFQPIGGMDQIPRAFARELGERVTLDAPVTRIRQTEDEVRVEYRDGRTGRTETLQAEYVVSCIPFSVLSTLDAGLSADTLDLIGGVRYSTSAKVGLQTKRRFWEEDDGIFGGPAFTNLPLGQFSYPSTGFYGHKGVLLGFYANEEVGGLDQLSAPDRIRHVVELASRFHPQLAEEFESGYSVLWSRMEFSRGAYAGSPGPRLERMREPDGRIYLGCAAVSTSPAWMEGAFSAAWSSVDRVHRRVQAA